jgi:hypothetical protein
MRKTESKFYFQKAYRQTKVRCSTCFFIIIKVVSLLLILLSAVIEGEWFERILVHQNEKSLHHAGSYIAEDNSFIKSSDMILTLRNKSELSLYTDVRLYYKKQTKEVREQCLKDKVCFNIQECEEPKCIVIKESLIEQDAEKIRVKDSDKLKMLNNFFFYVRPKSDYITERVLPQVEEIMVFYPAKEFNVFSLKLIFKEAINSLKTTPNDTMVKQNWQNMQRVQEVMGELDIVDDTGRILHPKNKIQMK